MSVKVGDLIKVLEDPIYDPYGYGNQWGIIIKDGRQTAKVFWIYPKWTLAESWVHYNRLERIEDRTDSDHDV